MKSVLPFCFLLCSPVVLKAAAIYEYKFEASDPTVNSGTGSVAASASGSITSGAGAGASGFFGDFNQGNDRMDVNVSTDGILLGQFELAFSVNDSTATEFDDFIGLSATGGYNLAFERVGAANDLAIYEVGNSAGAVVSTGTLVAGTWVNYKAVGSTSGADAVIELFANDVSQGTVTYVGAATETLQILRVGGRVGATNRDVVAGIDEVSLAVPEPNSLLLIGLGLSAGLIRRRK